METHTHMNINGELVQCITYAPNGASHALQYEITKILHKITEGYGKFTLAELGYLHINTLTYDKETGAVDLRIYFDIRLAARAVENRTNRGKIIAPVAELNIFKNYLFVGDIKDAVNYEVIMAPKTKIIEDECHRPSLKMKDDSKFVETNVLVLHCSLPLTMASIHDIDLSDENFTVRCTTVAKGAKTAVSSIITTVNMKEVPVGVTVCYSANNIGSSYNPDEAVPYLLRLNAEQQAIAENKNKLQQKVRKEAKDKKKNADRSRYKGFNKYS